jgi:hypothetical protein
MIYFQGTDDKLWGVNPDGSGGVNIGGYKTKSTPVVRGDSLYFQGTDDKLWKVSLDGSNGVNLGGYKTSSSPFVTDDHAYFQGTDDKLWRIKLDGTDGVHLGEYDTKSTPFVTSNHVYFQGTDDKLWRIELDGSGGINVGLYQAKSSPFATRDYVYFQGTDDKLWKISLDGPTGVNLGGYKTHSTPFVTREHVYFQGTDDKLWQIDLDGNNGVNLGGYKTKSSPVVDFGLNLVLFQGTDNALWRINLDGSGGDHIGGFDTASTPCVVQPETQTGTVRLPYYILTILYAPPGFNNGKSASSVDYASTSSTGATTSLSSSFKDTFGVSASVGPDASAVMGGFTRSETNTDSSSIDIKKSWTYDLSVAGPPTDGIDHDKDRFYLWLNPMLTITIDPDNNLDWELGVDGPTMMIQYVEVAWLKDPSKFPPGVKRDLDAAGLTPADYATILDTDPFSYGKTDFDPNRFLPTTQSFPYEPPDSANDPVPVEKYTQTNTVTYTAGHTTTVVYGVSIGGSIHVPILGSLKLSGAFEWTDTSSSVSTLASSQSATVTVGGPAFGYAGPTDVLVYWDTVFNSWMFRFPNELPSLSGAIVNRHGKSVARRPVRLSGQSHAFGTVTDSKGQYRFYGTPSGKVQISIHGEDFAVDVGPNTTHAPLLKLTRS